MNKYTVKNYINLVSPILGSKIYSYTDQFFGNASRMLSDNPPIFKENVYDKHGKWMDGWETRRKRTKGNDYCIIKLGKPGKVSIVEIDTSYFNGNQPEYASLDVCLSNNNKFIWKNILKKKKLKPNSIHKFKIQNNYPINFVKLNIFPDGGIARLKLLGDLSLNLKNTTKPLDLASVLNGAKIVACSDEHFGKAENIIAPGKSINMGNGWETKRRRGKGCDWIIIKLAETGTIEKFNIQTHHFKGNYPASFNIQGSLIKQNKNTNNIVNISKKWSTIINQTNLKPHHQLVVANKIKKQKFNFIKLNIYPDGGISRLRIIGKV